ncbi:MAG: FAD-dependent oxidoreductase [Chloroflexota bacterium]|nr:FAD-dependent oxidoreductase [Chloroflexota bacterium]
MDQQTPVIFAVIDDATTRDRLSQDLKRRFGADYRVNVIASALEGITSLDALRATGDEVAAVIADRELPEMTGIAFLDRADDLHPGARRGLLVRPGPAGMTDPIRRALLFDHVDFQIAAPWVSPEEWLYPTVTEALSAWTRLHRPHDEAITLIDRRWDPRGHDLRDLLERSGVPYGFYAEDSPHGKELLAKHGLGVEQLPVAIHRDGSVLLDPSNEELADAIGVATQPPGEPVDVCIIGAGPAGLAAAVYAASEGLQTVVVEAGALGGQAATTNQILNYLGFPHGLSGRELTTRAYFQALLFGTHFVFMRRAVDLRTRDGMHVLTLDNGTEVVSQAVVAASGSDPRRLSIPALEGLVGRGVFYGATGAEAAALRGEEVCVVGGGNAAGQSTLHLAKYAARVTLIVRGDSLAPDMSDYLIQRLAEAANVAVRLNTSVVDGIGERRLHGVQLEERATKQRDSLPVAALFVEIGGEPNTGCLPETLARDERGHLLTGRDLLTDAARSATWPLDRLPLTLETSIPGVFAAGDIRRGRIGRVAAAVGDGAVAIRSVQAYLSADATSGRDSAGPVVTASPGLR